MPDGAGLAKRGAVTPSTSTGLRKNNTSGYRGVSLEKSTGKWAAYIRRDGKRRFLGLFDAPEAAAAAYAEADKHLSAETPDRRSDLIAAARRLYEEHGLSALAADFLNTSGVSEGKLRRAGLSHAGLLAELGLTDEYERWRAETFTYAGRRKPRWTWERAVEAGRELADREGDLPTVEWCRLNGYSQLANTVHRAGRDWEDLRVALGLPSTRLPGGRPRYFESRTGVRWRSRAEACLSNFLYARGVAHKRGERYPDAYAAASGRKYGRFDLHFKDASGRWIDVEIWGDIPDTWSQGRYSVTRAKKEAWRADDPTFCGIQYQDCLREDRLTVALARHIGVVPAFQFDKPQDRHIESAHWSDADEMLETCRQLAALQPDGIFPNEQWLRKRGKYADRPGDAYNTLAVYIQTKLGGTRNVRQLLGQCDASTTKWTPQSVIEAWRQFEHRTGLTPAQCKGGYRQNHLNREIMAEGAAIYEVARRLGVLDQAREGQTGRKRKWTPERVEDEWQAFCSETGRTPTECMSGYQRARLPRSVTDRATRLYQAAKRLGLLEALRAALPAVDAYNDA